MLSITSMLILSFNDNSVYVFFQTFLWGRCYDSYSFWTEVGVTPKGFTVSTSKGIKYRIQKRKEFNYELILLKGGSPHLVQFFDFLFFAQQQVKGLHLGY